MDAIVGNPPFLGGKRMRDGLGDAYVEQLFQTYRGRVPAEADFVTYWVEKAWRAVSNPPPLGEVASKRSAEDGGGSPQTPYPDQAPSTASRSPSPDGGGFRRAGLVTTNSIRGGASRRVLDPIADAGAIWEAWADEAWALQGAAVRVSMIGFGDGFVERRLEGQPVDQVRPDLTGAGVDLTKAVRLQENAGVAFQGVTKGAPFEITAELARRWLKAPLNPNGRSNAEVLRPITSGGDIVRRGQLDWVIDFDGLNEAEAALFGPPFDYTLIEVAPARAVNKRKLYRDIWWRFSESRPGFRAATRKKKRFIATPKVAKTRVFVWLQKAVLPDNLVIAIAADDDCTFGVLSWRGHELWSLRLGAWIGVGNDPTYTPSTTFETFPFPEGLTPNIPSADYADDPRAVAIAQAARELNQLRENWLNPPDLVRIEPEVVPGYPDRVLPRDEAAAKVLKTRTLTNLYNQRPAWLDMAHRRLDAAVAAAYDWPADLTDDEILERLFALNQERAKAGR